MQWHVQYREGGDPRVEWYQRPELAIDAACRLMDAGVDVFAIGMSELQDSVGHDVIGRIYDVWVRTRPTRAG